MQNKGLISAVSGEEPMDFVIHNCKLVNVLTGLIHPAVIGIKNGYIATVQKEDATLESEHILDAGGNYVLPGLVDIYANIGKSMLTPFAYTKMILPHGTTTVVMDMNTVVGAMGKEGLALYMAVSRGLPVNFYASMPVQTPLFPNRETGFGTVSAEDIFTALEKEGIVGIGPAVWSEELLEEQNRFDAIGPLTLRTKKRLAGYAREGDEAQKQRLELAGLSMEILEDDPQAADNTLVRGQYLAVSGEKMTNALVGKLLKTKDLSRLILHTGSMRPDQLDRHAHLDGVIRKAIEYGMEPMDAIQSATIRPAHFMGLEEHGCIRPGKRADICIVESLEKFHVLTTMCAGEVIYNNGNMVIDHEEIPFPEETKHMMRMKKRWPHNFILPQTESAGLKGRVLVANKHNNRLDLEERLLPVKTGRAIYTDDILHMAIFDRHENSQTKVHGLLRGLGQIHGAVASTYTENTGNLMVFGDNDDDLAMACNMLIASGGGLCAVQNGQLISSVDLPLGGICGETDLSELSERIQHFHHALTSTIGMAHNYPLEWVLTVTNTANPGYHLTDMGILYPNKSTVMPVWVDPEEIIPDEYY